MPKLEMIKDGHLGGYIRGGDPGTWCPHLWSWAVEQHAIRSVMDVGCGEGHSTRYFQSLGCDVRGVEGSRKAIDESVLRDRIVQHDFCEGPYDPGRSYDMVWSCEFLEHVDRKHVPSILGTFARAAKLILVTHAFPGQDDGHHHVNCQPSTYWIREIERLGFTCDVHLSRTARSVTLRDYAGVNHFARSGLVFVRTSGDPLAKVDVVAPLGSYLGAGLRALRIHHGFRWSPEYRLHVRTWRAIRRQAKRSRAGAR